MMANRNTSPLPALASNAGAWLEVGYLHEIHCSGADMAGAMAFALADALADSVEPVLLASVQGKPRPTAQLYAEGLIGLGLSPGRLLWVETRNETDLLRAALDAARSPALAGVLVASEGRLADYDLTASRRLALALEGKAARAILLRIDAEPRPSAARSRWQVASAPSFPLEARAPGLPALEIELLRRRGGPAGQRFILVWDRHHGRFVEAPVPGDLAALPVGGTGAASVPGHLRAA